MGTLSARFMPNRSSGISQPIYMISSRNSVDLEKLPQFGRSNDFKERSPVDERSIVQKTKLRKDGALALNPSGVSQYQTRL
jgi:hypothetical protein